MDEQQNDNNWLRYSSIWRKVLTRVLEWPAEQVDQYTDELRQLREASNSDPLEAFGFFYDLPSRYLFRAILGNGLHEQIMQCESDEANPHLIYERLIHAITGNQLEQSLEKADFDWDEARKRYQKERQNIEGWLTKLKSNDQDSR
jgi:hypothetical protein